MEKVGGVYKIPCKVNGLSLKFIFDTGASDVSLSLTEALFMLKNGYLSEKDFLGTEYYRIANGDIQEGTKVNLKVLEVGGQKIYNVTASISHTVSAPLLFGQSALQRFGKFSIDYSNNTLNLGTSTQASSTTKEVHEKEIRELPQLEIMGDNFCGIYFGETKESINRNGKSIELIKDTVSLMKHAYVIARDDLNFDGVTLQNLVYVFSEKTNLFYKVWFQGAYNQKKQMVSILEKNFGQYQRENAYDDIHILQWVSDNVTITYREVEKKEFSVSIENYKFYGW